MRFKWNVVGTSLFLTACGGLRIPRIEQVQRERAAKAAQLAAEKKAAEETQAQEDAYFLEGLFVRDLSLKVQADLDIPAEGLSFQNGEKRPGPKNDDGAKENEQASCLLYAVRAFEKVEDHDGVSGFPHTYLDERGIEKNLAKPMAGDPSRQLLWWTDKKLWLSAQGHLKAGSLLATDLLAPLEEKNPVWGVAESRQTFDKLESVPGISFQVRCKKHIPFEAEADGTRRGMRLGELRHAFGSYISVIRNRPPTK